MALTSILRSHRKSKRQAEATLQLIVFQLRHERFALPIQWVQKVVPLGQVYGDPEKTGISLTIYQDRELLVIDVGHRIFGLAPNPLTSSGAVTEELPQQYLLLIQDNQGTLVGLPIDGQPALRRVPQSAITPLPPAYLSTGNIRCVSSLMVVSDAEPPLFLLDPNQLTQSLLPTSGL